MTGGQSRRALRWWGALLGAIVPGIKAVRQDVTEALS